MATTNLAALRESAKLPAKAAGGSTVAAFFEANRGALAAVLPKHMTPDRLMKTALGAIRNTPILQECTVTSLFGALVQSAALGLEPNTVLGHAYLVPFWNGREKRRDVQLIVGYRGLIDLARRSGQIVSIAAHAVRENDEFDVVLGTDGRITHRPNLVGERGEIVAFYAVAHMRDGGIAFEVMSRRDVDRVAKGTQSKGESGPWKDHYDEMGRKTVIRRLAKYLPLSIELAAAVDLDERADTGRTQGLDRVLEGAFRVGDTPPDDEPPVDAAGEEFDPALHSADGDGIPVLNGDGTFRRKPGRRPGAEAMPVREPQPDERPAEEPGAGFLPDDYGME